MVYDTDSDDTNATDVDRNRMVLGSSYESRHNDGVSPQHYWNNHP